MFGWKSSTTRRRFFSTFMSAVAGMLAGSRAETSAQSRTSDKLTIGRRVVTGFDSKGKSIILSDGSVPKAAIYDDPGDASGYHAWFVRSVPADLTDASDPVINGWDKNEPPKGGVIARITTWYPGSGYPMHTTETIDFGIVLSGNLELGLEAGSTVLGPGDLVVQRGTPHSWKVVGDKPCTVAFILIDATKKRKSRQKSRK